MQENLSTINHLPNLKNISLESGNHIIKTVFHSRRRKYGLKTNPVFQIAEGIKNIRRVKVDWVMIPHVGSLILPDLNKAYFIESNLTNECVNPMLMNGNKSSVIATVFNQNNISKDLNVGSEYYTDMIYINQEEEELYYNNSYNTFNQIEFKITNEMNMSVDDSLFSDWLIQLTFCCFDQKNNVVK